MRSNARMHRDRVSMYRQKVVLKKSRKCMRRDQAMTLRKSSLSFCDRRNYRVCLCTVFYSTLCNLLSIVIVIAAREISAMTVASLACHFSVRFARTDHTAESTVHTPNTAHFLR